MSGRVLNSRYELTEKVGEGGMAVTWKGRDLLLGRQVAVKLMRESLAADQQFITCFRQEAQAAAGLTHEHIAAVYDFGSDEGAYYIVMEYVPGEDLRRRLKRKGRLSVSKAVELAIQVAEALEAAHAKGIVHRDIKPANILLTSENQAKVADFGIARAAASTEETSTDMLLGSVHYISPEQARGEAVGPQADIYSLGAVLYEMLTGRPPFQASNPVAVVHKHIYDSPPSLHSARPDTPAELEGIIHRCLAKELNGRYASARELLSYLRALQSRINQEQAAAPTEDGAKSLLHLGKEESADRRRLAIILLIVMVALLVTVLAVFSGSKKDEVVEVPSLIGMDLSSAQVVAEAVGLEIRETGKVYSTTVDAGRIVSQYPSENSKVEQGKSVNVMLSLGRESVLVPEVTEMTRAQARRILEQASLTASTTKEEYDETLPEGMVIATEPPAGSEVPRQSPVILVISKGPEKPEKNVEKVPSTSKTPTPKVEPTEITFVVPATLSEAGEVVIEALDKSGRSILYRERIAPGKSIPPQHIPTTRPLTIRIKLNGQVVEERNFGQ